MGKVDLQIISTIEMSEKKNRFSSLHNTKTFLGNSKQKDENFGMVEY